MNKLVDKLPKTIRYFIGTILIIIGIIGLILPILPGWAPLITGVTLISSEHGRKLKKFIDRISHTLLF